MKEIKCWRTYGRKKGKKEKENEKENEKNVDIEKCNDEYDVNVIKSIAMI
jgi:hypothetical protein